MSRNGFNIGDLVVCNPAEVPERWCGIVYRIERFGPVDAILERVGGGRGLRANPTALLPAPAADDTKTTVAMPQPPLPVGTVVTIAGPRWEGGPEPHVILRDGGQAANLAQLGGTDHRYWRRIPRTWLTTIDRQLILDALKPLTNG
ncbi:hypothetical protein Cs7R123_32150 [Catellatospora sp. TT07R-123]|uniref:hypothetical protein n=1 Tax=Catellatospora sp. TT07R-123 TaxID=2733863 RepID=UPI001B051669|nr:hypothetical protein [Catellatospora sp. TT07R-123]GHJ45873.1 hypothetical protein Cs7R123_32150 [Catellatospora sp. TT07R-123]